MTATNAFSVFGLELFPVITKGNPITDAVTTKRSVTLATLTGPIIARHKLGHQLTSAGVDRQGTEGAWLPPLDSDASTRHLRDGIPSATGADIAVIIADSDGRADRRGATVISLGAGGIAPLRVTEHTDPAGIVLGQRGRSVPVAVVRGVNHDRGDAGVASTLHQ